MNRTPKLNSILAIAALSAGIVAAAAAASAPAVTKIRLEDGVWPGGLVSAYGSFWVASHIGPDVYRIDPHTTKLVKRIDIGENQCLPIAAGAGKLWVMNCGGETGHDFVYELSAKTNRVVHRYTGFSPVFGDGSLWMRNPAATTLLRIDPRSRLVLSRIRIPTGPVGQYGPFAAAACDGAIWLNADTSEIRIDTATNKLAAIIPLPGSRSDDSAAGGYFSSVQAACAGSKVWVPNLAGLYSIDEKTNTATRLPVKIKPNSAFGDPGVAAAGDKVFVRTSDTAVTEVDARSGGVTHIYPAGGGGGDGLAVGYGFVWVPAAASSAVWRERILAP